MATNDFDPTNSSSGESRTFDGNIQRDAKDWHVKENQWTYARNAISNSNIGDIGKLGNEPANKFCINAPYTIIGFIHLEKDRWAVFSTDNVNSEVGYFEEEICRYTKIVNSACLNFKTTNLIYGQSRKDFQCKYNLYWADGLNPDRYLPIGNIDYAPYPEPWPDVPWVCDIVPPTPVNDPDCLPLPTTPVGQPCEICVPRGPVYTLNCDKARLESLMEPICIQVSKGPFGGELLNGSYFALAAYTVNGQRVTDYCTPSNVQALFDHTGVGGALNINIYCIDWENFDEFELVIVSVVQQQAVAKRLGVYSTRRLNPADPQDNIYIPIDIIDTKLPSIPLDQLPIRNVIFEKSEAITEVNDHILRISPTSKFMFNYQPLANQIRVKWQSVEYSEDYYIKGGNNTGYMRDEVYSFFIRWVYETGDYSASFHIPGRPPIVGNAVNGELEADPITGEPRLNPATNADVIELGLGYQIQDVPVWQVYNTAIRLTTVGIPTGQNVLCDGGVIIDEGYMGYWESSERYPDNKPEIWNSSAHTWSCIGTTNPYLFTNKNQYDLCGRHIRHHRFPDNDLHPNVSHFRDTNQAPNALSQQQARHIRIMGVKFENIRPPVDNDGNPIPLIVGYEILRGSRTGNRSVIAKGIINNMFAFNLEGNTNQLGLYQNYPYNDLHADGFISTTQTRIATLSVDGGLNNWNPNGSIRTDIFSFHSPETNFSNPYLGAIELKVYQDLDGTANIRYQYPAKHPKHVIPNDMALIFSVIVGVGLAVMSTRGKSSMTRDHDWHFQQTLGGAFAGLGAVGTLPNPAVIAGAAGFLATDQISTNLIDAIWLGGNNFLSSVVGLGYAKRRSVVGIPGLTVDAADIPEYAQDVARYVYSATVGGQAKGKTFTQESGINDTLPLALSGMAAFFGALAGGGIAIMPTWTYFLAEGTEAAFKMIQTFASPQQHALQVYSHCLYEHYAPRGFGQRRRLIDNRGYIDNQIHNFGAGFVINNLYRNRFVALRLDTYGNSALSNSLNNPFVIDRTRENTRLRDLATGSNAAIRRLWKNPEINFQRPSSTYYTALKQRLINQYGQINNIVQIPISCTVKICPPAQIGGRINISSNEGFNVRISDPNTFNAPLICPNNVIRDPQFPNPASIDLLPAPWQSGPQDYFQHASSSTGGSVDDVASNSGGAVPTPSIPTTVSPLPPTTIELVQNLIYASGPNTGQPLICLDNQPYTLSFLIKDFPISDPRKNYTLKVYAGPVSVTNFVATITSSTITSGGGLPYTFTTPAGYNLPVNASGDDLRFVLEGPDDPATTIIDIRPTNNTIPDFNDRCYVSIINPELQFGSTVGGPPLLPYLTTGQKYTTSFPIGTNNYPQLYGNITNYLEGLLCPTTINYNITIRAFFYDCSPIVNSGPVPLQILDIRLVALRSSDAGGTTGQLISSIVNNIYNPGIGPDGVGPFAANFTGTINILNPDPAARYAFIITTRGITYFIDGYTLTVDHCRALDRVSITDVCLQCNNTPAVVGCMDQAAVNYNPGATSNQGCIYCGCCDPTATNFSPQTLFYSIPANQTGGERAYCCGSTPACPTQFTSNCPCQFINPGGGGGGISAGVNGPCTSNCLPVVGTDPISYDSYTMFGGDIYINRYTEKNTFFYFFDWLYDQPDRTEWEYLKYKMIPWPTYWMNLGEFSVSEFVTNTMNFITNPVSWIFGSFNNIPFPSEYQVLDRPSFSFAGLNVGFHIKYGYIYLFNSGVRDFFVESEYNVDLRDFGDTNQLRHYQSLGRDSYTDLSSMFDTSIIKFANYYKYDNSLSVSRIYYSYTSWGSMYPSYYSPYVAETCYQYRPNRIMYSLPVDNESVRDGWRIFLSQNYKEFISKVTTVKQINKSGALILFESDSPVMFQGTDQLQTDIGTKLTIGDGGLFSQPMQSLMNAERPYEYGSCQNKLSVVNTPVGVFWISQNQGKIYQYSSGLDEISLKNIKWWLAQFLPYQLLKYFPTYKLKDNPVEGIGCQTTYDNTNNIVYFTKKDYKPVLDTAGEPLVGYDEDGNYFYDLANNLPVSLTNPRFFQKASWTLSYDVKTSNFISYHDWHPDLVAPGPDNFMTTKGRGVWIHNDRCDLYANYYGVNYPFEIEYLVDTVQTVNTLRSIEYQLEVYKYKYENCYDRFHVVDFNFDEAVVYNTEQCSGKLKLFLTPKNNAPAILQYPIINPSNISILYSKEENKYRFNQFWDITKDRGEFDWIVNNNQNPPVAGDLQYPPVPTTPAPGGVNIGTTLRQQTIWDTEPNGYVRVLNNFNLNYSTTDKPLQHKKFRHYKNSVVFKRLISGNKKMLISIANNKNLVSPR